MSKKVKHTIQEMKKIALSHGGKCLSTEYTNSTTKLKWECSQGHQWEAIPKSIKSGGWCPHCAGRGSLTIENAKKIAFERGGKCLSEKLTSSNEKLTWECNNGHTWKASLPNVKGSRGRKGTWCPYCTGRHKPITFFQSLAKERGGKCLSNEYLNSAIKLSWICKEGHEWKAIPVSVIRGGWCPVCANKKKGEYHKLTIEDMRELAEERGGTCLSKNYVNSQSKLKWKCSQGHVWEATPSPTKQGSWCQICSSGVCERICRVYFEQLFNKSFPKARPPWLINEGGYGMEFDGYCEELKLAFEHQGKMHYKHIGFFHKDKDTFDRRQRDDLTKEELAKKHGITLISVPEIITLLPLSGVKKYIVDRCKELGFKHIPINAEEIKIDLRNAYSPSSKELYKEVQELAALKGGRCLDGHYLASTVKMHFECKEGHKWSQTSNNLKRGNWCPKCAREHSQDWKRLDINEMHELAKKKGGKCLSNKYVDNKEKLKWECKKGHTWLASPDKIKRGNWCPLCRGRHKSIEFFQSLAKGKDGRCLSDKYQGNKQKLKWQCKEGHIWKTLPPVIMKGHWCPYCAGMGRLTIEEAKRVALDRGGKCLSDELLNGKQKLIWECSKGHKWKASLENIKGNRGKKGTWCPTCARGKNRHPKNAPS